ncbi:MAG: 30S ribosome-binding factor RbfA [Caldimicrobium sp.]
MSRRAERVASLLKEAISEIILHDLNDPIFKDFISLTHIDIGSDLKRAIIYFRVFERDPKEIERALNRSKGYIKRLLAEKITLKFLPEIEFKIDTTEEEEKKLIELFEKIKKA